MISRERVFLIAISLIAVALLSGPYIDFGGRPGLDSFASNRAKWQGKMVLDYRYKFGIAGPWDASVDIEVRNGKPVRVIFPNRTTVDEDWATHFDTIDKVFRRAHDELYGDAAEVDIEYDPTFGFPANIRIDKSNDTRVFHDEFSYYISRLEVLKP